MKLEIKTNIDTLKILKSRGLGTGGEVDKMLASEVARLSDPYVPMSPGASTHVKTQVDVAPGKVTYKGPYARFLYHGKVMIGRFSRSPWARKGEPKDVTNRDLQFHGAPMRGPFWDKRMMADKGDALLKALAAWLERRSK